MDGTEIRTPDDSLRSPRVSVIIPAYNAAPYIRETLDSVFAQTFIDFEVIVVNDGSPDTPELARALQPYRSRIRYLRQENAGPAAARNAAIKLSRAPWIALLDSDDVWEPEYLAVQVRALENDSTLDVIYPNAIFFGDAPEAGRTFMDLCPSEGEVTFESLLTQQCNVMVSVTARRAAMIRAGMFDESAAVKGSEDFDLWLRIVKQGGRIAYHRRVLVRYRRHAGSLASNPVRMCKSALQVLDKCERTMPLSGREAEVLRQERARFHATLRFCEGKNSFFKGDPRAAVEALTEANEYFKSRKVTLALILLRAAPRLLRRVYALRDRFVFRASTEY
jgi:glycosyltransferase involved in cell wall biosynthesis